MTTSDIIIVSAAAVVAVVIIVLAISFAIVGREAFKGGAASAAAGSLGLLFLELPALVTIAFIVLATGTLTAMQILPANGCIAIFSSISSFVLGAETQKRREGASRLHDPSDIPAQRS